MSMECCFSELKTMKIQLSVLSGTKQTPSSSHWNVTCSCHNIAEKLLTLALYNNHSLSFFFKQLKCCKCLFSVFLAVKIVAYRTKI
jgi:hypothetical protein